MLDDNDRFCSDPLVDNLGKGSFGVAVFPVGFAVGWRKGLVVVVVVLCSWLAGSKLLLERP